MTYEIVVTRRAADNIEAAFNWWAENRSTEQAARWYNAFADKLADLAANPLRWPESPERPEFPYVIRDFYFGLGKRPTHRAIFTIRGQTIVLLAVRRPGPAPLRPR